MSSPNLRLFLAAPVPEGQLAWVAEQTEALGPLWPGARWVPTENQHVTLKFLGSTAPDLLDAVAARCRQIATAHAPSTLRLSDLGAFPNPRRARVLWVGLDDPAGLLASLAAALDGSLKPLGFASEGRTFTPHLTLARFKTPLRLNDLPPLGDPPAAFRLGGFDLWRSHLGRAGARYERLVHFALGGARAAPAGASP